MYKYVDFSHVHLPPFVASKLAVKNDTQCTRWAFDEAVSVPISTPPPTLVRIIFKSIIVIFLIKSSCSGLTLTVKVHEEFFKVVHKTLQQ